MAEASEMKITVKAARVNAGMTQEQAAKALNMSITTYKKKENGKSRFYIDEISRLGILFGVKVELFFEAQCRKKTQNVAM